LPLPAPIPLDALRQLTRAVVLTAEGCELSDDLRAVALRSGVTCEVVDHPLAAVAALVGIEREGSTDRAALVVAERQIDDLDGLFATIRSRMQRISIWVFEADFAIDAQRGAAPPPTKTEQRDGAPRPTPSAVPTLRISRVSEPAAVADAPGKQAEAEADPAEDPPEASGNTVTAEELKMLLDLFEDDRPSLPDGGGPR